MVNRMRHRPALLAALSALALVGCASPATGESPSAESSPTEPPAATPSPAATTLSASPTPEADDEASPAPSASASEGEPEDMDLQDGIRTNDFQRLPEELAGLNRVRAETDPGVHWAELEFMAPDQSAKMLLRIFLVRTPDGAYVPVASQDDEYAEASYASAVENLGQRSDELLEREASTPDRQWRCVEALKVETGVDQQICHGQAYGRVVEMQRLSAHEPDAQARNAAVDEVLADLSAGLDALA